MPFQLFYLPSFERCLKKLGSREKRVSNLVVEALLAYFQSGIPVTGDPYIFHQENRSHRLVFKKLRANIWEAYIERQVRILTRLDGSRHFLVFAGNHDQVRQFLKKN